MRGSDALFYLLGFVPVKKARLFRFYVLDKFDTAFNRSVILLKLIISVKRLIERRHNIGVE